MATPKTSGVLKLDGKKRGDFSIVPSPDGANRVFFYSSPGVRSLFSKFYQAELIENEDKSLTIHTFAQYPMGTGSWNECKVTIAADKFKVEIPDKGFVETFDMVVLLSESL